MQHFAVIGLSVLSGGSRCSFPIMGIDERDFDWQFDREITTVDLARGRNGTAQFRTAYELRTTGVASLASASFAAASLAALAAAERAPRPESKLNWRIL
jgi:hypothetical protein